MECEFIDVTMTLLSWRERAQRHYAHDGACCGEPMRATAHEVTHHPLVWGNAQYFPAVEARRYALPTFFD